VWRSGNRQPTGKLPVRSEGPGRRLTRPVVRESRDDQGVIEPGAEVLISSMVIFYIRADGAAHSEHRAVSGGQHEPGRCRARRDGGSKWRSAENSTGQCRPRPHGQDRDDGVGPARTAAWRASATRSPMRSCRARGLTLRARPADGLRIGAACSKDANGMVISGSRGGVFLGSEAIDTRARRAESKKRRAWRARHHKRRGEFGPSGRQAGQRT